MKYIRKMIGRTIVIICCVIQIFVGIQPIHSMVAENDNHISGNSVWADSPSLMGGGISYCNGGVHRDDSL